MLNKNRDYYFYLTESFEFVCLGLVRLLKNGITVSVSQPF